jgi:hypothetical protein
MFEFGTTFNKFTRFTCGEGGIIYSITSNPIYLSLLLTALVMITIIAIIGEDTEDVLEKKDFIRLGIYIWVVTCIIVSMHHYTYLYAMKEYQSQNGLQRIYNTISDVSNNPNMVSYPVLGRGEDFTTPEQEQQQHDAPASIPIPTPVALPAPPNPNLPAPTTHEIEDVNLDL